MAPQSAHQTRRAVLRSVAATSLVALPGVAGAASNAPVDWASPRWGADPSGVKDSTVAIQAAVNFAQANNYPLKPTPGTYLVSSEIKVSTGTTFYLDGRNCAIKYNGPYPFITSPATPDTGIPTANAPGPMRGSVFYVTIELRYSIIKDIKLLNARFGVSFLANNQKWTFQRVTFSSCNTGVFMYAGCLAFTFSSCVTLEKTNNLFIGAATCYIKGNPYGGPGIDVAFCDALYVGNESDGVGSLTCDINSHWDSWFQSSILQPTVGSYTIAGNNYTYPYPLTDAVCNPSGRPIYMPFRNPRTCYQFNMTRLDNGFQCAGGWAIINTAITQLRIDHLTFEGMFEGAPSGTPWFIFGSFFTGVVIDLNTEENVAPSDVGHPFARVTGAGGASDASALTYIACKLTPAINH
jgi:hypothetical protein